MSWDFSTVVCDFPSSSTNALEHNIMSWSPGLANCYHSCFCVKVNIHTVSNTASPWVLCILMGITKKQEIQLVLCWVDVPSVEFFDLGVCFFLFLSCDYHCNKLLYICSKIFTVSCFNYILQYRTVKSNVLWRLNSILLILQCNSTVKYCITCIAVYSLQHSVNYGPL